MNTLTYLYSWVFCALFLCLTPLSAHTSKTSVAFNQPQLVRLDFTMPNGYVRHLLLGFTPDNAATDGFDYGYDAANMDNYPDDLNWLINNQRYIIQGVGAFDDSKQYPLGMFLSNTGDIEIALNSLENFNNPIDVYLFDALNNSYTLLNDLDFEQTVLEGIYLDRFFITFKDNSLSTNILGNILSVSDSKKSETSITYLRNSNQLYCKSNQIITQIEIYNIIGKRIGRFQNLNSYQIRLPLNISKERYGIVQIQTQNGQTSKKIMF